MDLFKLIFYIIDIGVRLSLSTGGMYEPSYQERTCAVQDVVIQESDRWEPNFEYSETDWTPTFKLKKGE